MAEPAVRVESYSAYKADERPIRLHLGARSFQIAQIEDRWYEPGATFFRVVVEDGDRYVLRHEEAQDVWTIAAYRARNGWEYWQSVEFGSHARQLVTGHGVN